MRRAPIPVHRPPRPSPGHLVPVGRWLLGRPYDGRPKTDATWANAGTGHYDPDQAGWWAHQSFRRRTAIIWTALVGVGLSIYGWVVSPYATVSAQRLAAWLGIILIIHTTIYRTRRWQPFKQYTEPVHLAIHHDLDISRKCNPRGYIHLPRDGSHIHDPDQPLVITLPDRLAIPEGNGRAKIAHKAAEAAGIMADQGQFFAHWEMNLQPRTLTVACNPQPPDLVPFSAIVDHWREAAPDEIVFGLSHTGAVVKRSLNIDAPHILLSVGPGGGKTEFCCAVALQRLARGAQIIYVDIAKRGFSAKWAKYIEGIEIIRQVEVAYNTFLWLYEEIQRRSDVGYEDDSGTYGPGEIFVIFDEANSGFAELKRYEKQLRRDDKTAPSAIDAYERIAQVGREPRIHLLTVTQKGSHRGTGGGDIRDSHGIVCASRFNPRVGRMLFDGIGDGTRASLPRSSDHPGRLQVTSGVGIDECQGVLLIDKPPQKQLLPEPADFIGQLTPIAPSAPPAAPVSAACPTGETAGQRVSYTPTAAETPGEVPVEAELVDQTPAPQELVDLRTAAERLHGKYPNVTLNALRNYRGDEETREEFPRKESQRGQTFLYDLAKVDRFLANRPRAGS